ncbi:MAG: hypothetical protein ACJA0Z_000624 [Halioglobus sp.]
MQIVDIIGFERGMTFSKAIPTFLALNNQVEGRSEADWLELSGDLMIFHKKTRQCCPGPPYRAAGYISLSAGVIMTPALNRCAIEVIGPD